MRSRAEKTLRRHEEGLSAPERRSVAHTWREQLRRLDVYTKLHDDVRVQTSSGAALTLLAGALMLCLFVAELAAFVVAERSEHIVVDPAFGQAMRIDFNVTFHALHCGAARICAMDVAGDQQLDIHHGIYKVRLDEHGHPMTSRYEERMNATLSAAVAAAPPLPAGYCGRCYGARRQELDPATKRVLAGQPCCNTCADVHTAYMQRGWGTAGLRRDAEQCVREAASAPPLTRPRSRFCMPRPSPLPVP